MKKNIMKIILLLTVFGIIAIGCHKYIKDDLENPSEQYLNTLSTQISKTTEFKTFVSNIIVIRKLAVASAYTSSFLYQKNPGSSEFVKSIYNLKTNDKEGLLKALNSQFKKGENINNLLLENVELSAKIRKEYPQLLNLQPEKRDLVITNAIQKTIKNLPVQQIATNFASDPYSVYVDDISDNPCITSCRNQYYVNAGVCALLVETVFGAAVCFVGASLGLSACKGGCPA